MRTSLRELLEAELVTLRDLVRRLDERIAAIDVLLKIDDQERIDRGLPI